MDFIFNGQSSGSVADQMLANGFDPRPMRPYIGADGYEYVDRMVNNELKAVRTGRWASNEQRGIIGNADSTLRHEEWKLIDRAVIRVARERLQGVADVRARGLEYTLPNGMGHTVLQHQTQSDVTPAVLSMDGIAQSQRDRPHYESAFLPIPIIHKDFDFSARQLQVSRNGNTPLDTTMIEMSTRKVAEEAEDLLLGTGANPLYKYGGGTIYGFTNYVHRLTKSMTVPTGSATNEATVNEVLDMRQLAYNNYYRGPFVLYISPDWDKWLDADYSATKGTNTLRQRIAAINGINDIQTIDRLTGYQMILVQLTTDVVREVVGMEITPIRWESQGGMQINFKVMAIMVPQLRADYNNRTGIVHGTAS